MRNRKTKLIWKMLLGVFILAGICVAMISLLRGSFKEQVEGEYIKRSDAIILAEQLECPIPWVYEDDADNKSIEEVSSNDMENVNRQTEVSDEDYLTYKEYIEWLRLIYNKRQDVFREDELERFSEGILSASYSKKHKLLKSDFMNCYLELSQLLVPQKEIAVDAFVVLGGTGQVYSLEGEGIAEGQVLIARGEEMLTEEIRFNGYEAFLYKNVTVVRNKDEVILTLSKEDTDFSLKRAWIGSNTEEGLKVNYQGKMLVFPYQKEVYDSFEEIADLSFRNGSLYEVCTYDEKINGKLITVTDDAIELENIGNFKLAEDIQVYKLYGQKEQYTVSDLKIGYDFTDFVLDGDTIIAALVTREEAMDNIRVAIKTNDFASLYHEKISITPDCDYVVIANGEQKEYKAGETLEITKDSEIFDGGRVKVVPKVLTGTIAVSSLQRAQGTPKYRGTMEISCTEQGLVMVNELLLEEYLYSVVPSEMPASYPKEALKAQAITARTYAYKNMQKSALPNLGAHVDDSVSYQVYNNTAQSETTTLAVRETKGHVICYNGKLAETYFYSTSCGYSTDLSAWGSALTAENAYLTPKHISVAEGTESGLSDEQAKAEAQAVCDNETFARFISSKQETDFEKDMPFYRWTYETKMDGDLILERIKERYQVQPGNILTQMDDGSFESIQPKKLGKVKAIEVVKRSGGGAASEIVITGSKGIFKIVSEYNVRYILRNESTVITKQNGEEGSVSSLLPSSFFAITTNGEEDVESYTLTGGGYGHGIGMSQNGAKAMSEAGYTCEEILKFFYTGIEVLVTKQ